MVGQRGTSIAPTKKGIGVRPRLVLASLVACGVSEIRHLGTILMQEAWLPAPGPSMNSHESLHRLSPNTRWQLTYFGGRVGAPGTRRRKPARTIL